MQIRRPNGNNTELDDYEIAEPTIISSTNNHLAYYKLTVTDASTIQKRATRIVRLQLQSSGYDLVMRDSDVDMLDEPNMQARAGGRIPVYLCRQYGS